MFSCKLPVILLLLLSVSVGDGASNIQCRPLPGDTLLHREYVERRFAFLQYVTAKVYIIVGKNLISCVQAIDQSKNGAGGTASFTKGGIGYNYVEVQITSKFSRGFLFRIDVYGQEPRTRKYLRKCCVNFRTCPHTHHNCRYTTFYRKILSA